MSMIEKIRHQPKLGIAGESLLLVIWGALFIGGLVYYTGSALTYTLFSFVFLAMLVSGLVRQAGYGYLFLVVMLWLGFWLKVTVHLIFPYPFTEFTGRFDGGSASWDEVLFIATVAAAGVLAARLSVSNFRSAMFRSQVESNHRAVPLWYRAHRSKVWAGLLLSITAIAVLNAIYGFQQSGLVPRNILGWHLNGVVYYLLSIVFAVCCATLIWWDAKFGKSIAVIAYAVLFESITSSLSLLSRGALVFHAVPLLLALYKSRNHLVGYTKLRAVLMLAVLAVSIMATYSFVNMLRNHYYSNAPMELSVDIFRGEGGAQAGEGGAQAGEGGAQAGEGGAQAGEGGRFLRFAVDRWLGVEGVMAVASYPGKAPSLFWRGLAERSQNGKVSMYQEVCLSHYREMNASKFRFANLPGVAGFFYYTGSLWAVLVGLMGFTIVIIVFEGGVFFATGNPLVCAFVGGALANTVCQFGVTPSNLVPMFIALVGAIALVWVLQAETGRRIFGRPKYASDKKQ